MRHKLSVLLGLALISGVGLLGYAYGGENEKDGLSEGQIRFCQNSHQQYVLVGEEKYLKMYDYDFLSKACVMLYNDPVWQDADGDQKTSELIEKSEELISVSNNKEEHKKVNEIKELNHLKKQNISLLQRLEQQKQMVDNLEKRVEEKNAIIKEQIKVILSLSSKGNS